MVCESRLSRYCLLFSLCSFFFFNDTATTEIYTLSLHDALPILVAYHLAKAGYRVITAVNGRDALRTARQERPDLVVLDLIDRKSTRLNSSHLVISYAVFCLKKKKHTPPTVTPVERA